MGRTSSFVTVKQASNERLLRTLQSARKANCQIFVDKITEELKKRNIPIPEEVK